MSVAQRGGDLPPGEQKVHTPGSKVPDMETQAPEPYHPVWCRTVRGAAGIFVAVAAIVVVLAILTVRAGMNPHATPENAVPAFSQPAILHVQPGALLFGLAFRRGGLTARVAPGVVEFFGPGRPLTGAASADAGHGAGMRADTVELSACAGGDLAAGVPALAAAFTGRPKVVRRRN